MSNDFNTNNLQVLFSRNRNYEPTPDPSSLSPFTSISIFHLMVQSIKPNLTIPIPTCRIQRKSFGFQPKRSLMRIYCRIWRQTLNVLKTFTNRNFKSDHSRVSDMLIRSKELRHSEDIVERNPYPHIIWEAVRSWRWRWEGQAVVTFFFP